MRTPSILPARFRSIAALVLVVLAARPGAGQSPSNAGTGHITGVVVRAGTAEPLAAAELEIEDIETTQRKVRTDKSGRFSFAGLAETEGPFCVTVHRKGFVYQPYAFCRNGLKPGEIIEGISINMQPAGAAAGIVADRQQRPLPLIPVDLLRATYDQSGREQLQSVDRTETNDRGEYRFHEVPPGRYVVAAGVLPNRRSDRWADLEETEQDLNRGFYARRYFPGERQPAQATPIDILPASDLRGLNFWLEREPLLQVSGRVIDSRTGKPPQAVRLSIIPVDTLSATPYEASPDGVSTLYRPSDGAFAIRALLRGTYTIAVTPKDVEGNRRSDTMTEKEQLEEGRRRSRYESAAAYTTVTVTDSHLDGIILTILPGGTLSVQIVAQAPLAANATTPRFAVSLTATSRSEVGHYLPGSHFTSYTDLNQLLHLDNMLPGQYRLSVTDQGVSGYYIKDAQLAGVDVLEHPLTVAPNARDMLLITVGIGTATVSGQVIEGITPQSQPLVVLVPNQLRDRPDRYQTTSADKDGRFTLQHVPPGDYRAFAWIDAQQYGYLNSDFLKRFEPYGVPVHVTDQSTSTLELRPAPVGP